MDTLHRTSRYKKFLTKLHKIESGSTGTSKKDDIYSSIQSEVNGIIESLRSRGDQSNSRIHFVILAALLGVTLLWHSIVTGAYVPNLIILLLLAGGLFVAQYRMKQVITLSQENAPRQLQETNDIKEFITLKMRYLDTAMDIKKARLLLVSLFYIVFTPILLVKLHEAALGSTPFDSVSMSYLVAYLLAGTLWYIYFNRAFEVYDDIEATMGYISDKLRTLD